MGSNIIAHLIFFSLHTFYMLILRACLVHVFKHMFLVFKQYYTYFHTLFYPYVFPKKKNWKLLFKHTYHCHTFGSSFNNTSLHFPISLFAFHLSLSLSLSLSWIWACARGKSSKKKPQLKQWIITKLLIFRLLWFFLNTNIVNLIFFFSLEKKGK